MIRIKKALYVIALIFVLLFLFSGCIKEFAATDSKKINETQNETTIVTSFYPIYIFTKNIALDIPDVNVVNLTQPETGCLHDYQLKPSDVKLLEKADLFVINGAGLEEFLEGLISQLPGLEIVEASKGIELLNDGEEVNPHVWVSISGAILEVKNIGSALAELDPKNADAYLANTNTYVDKLEKQKEKMHKNLKNIKNKNIVTSHESFPYFAKEFNLNIVEVVESEHGAELSPKQLSEKINNIKNLEVKALFAEPQYSSNVVDLVAGETGAKIFYLDPVVTGPDQGDPNYYTKVMDKNLEILVEALN